MGHFSHIARLTRRLTSILPQANVADTPRRAGCAEALEKRNLLAADLRIGAVYYEEASGQDEQPDFFHITWDGGPAGTQLHRLVIDTDKAGDGRTVGDPFFDIAPGGPGAFGYAPFKVVSQNGIDSVNVFVEDGGTLLVLEFEGFDAGETLIFTIDVDEQGFFADSSSAVVEGEELEGSILTATFKAPHYEDLTSSAIFFDQFDLDHLNLDLPDDSYSPPNETPHAVMTAGAGFNAQMTPLPITISGTVFEDVDLDNVRDADEVGISDVLLRLYQWNGSQYVDTGMTTITDASGNYQFDGVLPGMYQIVEVQPTGIFSVGARAGNVGGDVRGVVTSPDVIESITLLGGEDSVHNDFAEARPAQLSGYVYHDANDDGVKDPGESGIGGVTLEITRVSGPGADPAPITVVTAADGSWSATGLRPGTYRVRQTQPDGYLDGKDTPGNKAGTSLPVPGDEISGIVLLSGAVGINYNFGELKPSSISGRVHADRNDNCTWDPGEVLISGVTVYLLDAQGNRIGQTVTDANGRYEFTGLAPGEYGIEQVQPEGYYDSGEKIGTAGGDVVANDIFGGIILTSGTEAADYNFCEHEPASIGGFVYVDDNDNGVKEAAEAPIAGVTLELMDADGNPTGITTVTSADGSYWFHGLKPGVYGVRQFQPDGYFDGKDTAGSAGGVADSAADIITGAVLGPAVQGANYNFGELRPASISGRVHADRNGNCTLDDGEHVIAGVVIHLLDQYGNVIATTTTGSDGIYTFGGLAPGVYGIHQEQPEGYFDSGEKVGTAGGIVVANDTFGDITLGSGVVAVDYNFCEHEPTSIAGQVYVDDNDNGLRDAGEAPLAGVVLELLDANGNQTGITTVTGADGSYSFTGLAPGTYGIVQSQPSGYYDGKDRAGSAGGVAENPGDRITGAVLTPGLAATGYDFGELRPASLSGTVYVDDNDNGIREAGEVGIGGVTVELLDAAGNPTGITTVTDANGNYTFSNLAPGQYGVRQTQPSGYYDGKDAAGSAGGAAENPGDRITGALLTSGLAATGYNFGELRGGSISGRVHADRNGNCIWDPGEITISGVTIYLLDANGNRIAETQTDADGMYRFENLAPGMYGVEEVQPYGYFDSGQKVGSAGGTVVANDMIMGITLGSGTVAVDYNFCEHEPASIAGTVFADNNANGVLDTGDTAIAGVTLELLDSAGNATGIKTVTDAYGRYRFEELAPGSYGVMQYQPLGYYDGLDTAGTAGGVAVNPGDRITGAVLTPGMAADEYNFGELAPVSISGTVHTDLNGNLVYDADEQPLSGVTIWLLDANGNRVGSTVTGPDGTYLFHSLAPGVYGLEQIQPAGYHSVGEVVGNAGGIIVGTNLMGSINLLPGVAGLDYNFAEAPHGEISGYVFVDGDPIVMPTGQELDPLMIAALRPGSYAPEKEPIAGVTLRLGDATGRLLTDAHGNIIEAVTDSRGFYQFTGLAPGVYTVFQVHPEGYIDGMDTPGSAGGLAINANTALDLLALAVPHNYDTITGIRLGAGGVSVHNNFSEVLVQAERPVAPAIFPNNGLQIPTMPTRLAMAPRGLGAGAPSYPLINTLTQSIYFGGASLPVSGYTWHLSVINAGNPRGEVPTSATAQMVRLNRSADAAPWNENGHEAWEDRKLDSGNWTIGDTSGAPTGSVVFGIRGGTPVVGDWNGDGVSQIGVFIDGHWFLDLNGNGVWDKGDLWVKLGHRGDRPVTGDWDGDGKTDIATFGPAWAGDARAVVNERGLPDAENNRYEPKSRYTNLPPSREQAPEERRLLQRSERGMLRSELVDHVLQYGGPGDIPVSGDFNGDGIDTIGVFNGGTWMLDSNGDGVWQPGEEIFEYGTYGDLPVVGDFNGDGIDELGIFRDGKWYIDMNHNGRIDEGDLVFEFGEEGDTPIVGDWNGDGKAEPGVYRDGEEIRRAS